MLARARIALTSLAAGLVALAAPLPAAAQQTEGFSHGWLWALGTLAIVIALFLLLFKGRPPVGRQGPGPAGGSTPFRQ